MQRIAKMFRSETCEFAKEQTRNAQQKTVHPMDARSMIPLRVLTFSQRLATRSQGPRFRSHHGRWGESANCSHPSRQLVDSPGPIRVVYFRLPRRLLVRALQPKPLGSQAE